jgi:uncharacterized protein (TIGR04255 family)
VLACVENILPDLFVQRLGLRYVDVIVPRQNETPNDYVSEGLRGTAVETKDAVKFSSQYVANWKLSDGAMRFRFVNGIREPFMPADMKEVAFEKAEIISRAAVAKKELNVAIGALDFDRMKEHQGPMRANEISGLFSSMHDDASSVFKRSISKLAERVWNSKA